jgi:hypothetical protein
VSGTKGIDQCHGHSSKERLTGSLDPVAIEIVEDRSGNGAGGLETNECRRSGYTLNHGDGLRIVCGSQC